MNILSKPLWAGMGLVAALTASWAIQAAGESQPETVPAVSAEEAAPAAKGKMNTALTPEQTLVMSTEAPGGRNANLDFLYETLRKDPAKGNMIVDSNAPYVDLRKEIEMAVRVREKGTQKAAVDDEVTVRLKEMAKLKEELAKMIEEKTQASQSLQLLVSLYESISADKVAKILRQMPFSVSLAVMKTMSPRKSSKILAEMEDKYAAEMSRRLLQTNQKKISLQTAGGTP